MSMMVFLSQLSIAQKLWIRYDRRRMEGACRMGKTIYNKEEQVKYLKERLTIFMEVLEHIQPETTELEDIDRLISMIDELEEKVEQFKNREEV